MKYPNADSQSAALFNEAQKVLTEGGSRSTIRIAPYSIYVREAHGKYVTDVDGNKLFDLNNNYTSMIHGHAHPEVIQAAMEQAQRDLRLIERDDDDVIEHALRRSRGIRLGDGVPF